MNIKTKKLPELQRNNPSQMIVYSKDLQEASSQKYQKSLNLTMKGLISPIKHPYKRRSSPFVSISQSSSPKIRKENIIEEVSNWALPYLRKKHPAFHPSFKKKRMISLKKKLKARFAPYSIHGTSKSIIDRTASIRLVTEEIAEEDDSPIVIQKPSKITIFSRITSVLD